MIVCKFKQNEHKAMKIEKGITPPASKNLKYPWPQMQPGDSIFFAGQKANGLATQAARAWAERNGKKFVCKTQSDGVRIWRIE